MYLDYVGKDTCYGLLASWRGQLFRDADFAELYCLDNGRTSVCRFSRSLGRPFSRTSGHPGSVVL